ncbi:MAG: class II D-tagatose-bisphosphate aldolase, non-catalytic subunit [Clostridiales Family XIII bacterium]|jgi:D-tagatose-1,6-bisphosphate aldolase subunit GatZ/KbaZ|nr:class II D-tagatose-bisphosphate aldolase, non-catalytic subunit [Clostridiales Family XIII bacterium]
MKTNSEHTENTIRALIRRRASGEHCGIYAACTANAQVIQAVMEAGIDHGIPVLIEATANQCNQYGGYSGMLPSDFARYIAALAEKTGFDPSRVILGGDHLGPLVWKSEPAEQAMGKAEELVRLFVEAGFGKIHLDTSMKLADDDPSLPLSDDVIAERAARLAAVCEYAAKKAGREIEYVVGSEVPVPGGAQASEADPFAVTAPEDFEKTWAAFKKAFGEKSLDDALARVVGVVVQPGVEFGDDTVHPYDRAAAAALMGTLAKTTYDSLIFEGHSTDYQPRAKLRELVEDGVAILKVGPALTFYFREAVFALAQIEGELSLPAPSRFREVLDECMAARPDDWDKYYTGTEEERRLKRKYSFSDRSRYYFTDKKVRAALETLFSNIDAADVPASLLSQYLPSTYDRLRNSGVGPPFKAAGLARARVRDCIDDYLYAVL